MSLAIGRSSGSPAFSGPSRPPQADSGNWEIECPEKPIVSYDAGSQLRG